MEKTAGVKLSHEECLIPTYQRSVRGWQEDGPVNLLQHQPGLLLPGIQEKAGKVFRTPPCGHCSKGTQDMMFGPVILDH